VKLYYTPGACSLSPHIALREAGLAFDLEPVDLKIGKLKNGGADFKTVNPKGYVPALTLDDGSLLTEGAVMVQWIADQRPATRLAPPAGTMERVRLQEWLHYIATEIHKGISPLFNPKTPDEIKQATRDRLTERVGYLGRSLEGKSWLMGSAFSVADGYAFYALRSWQNRAGGKLADLPNLKGYFDRIAERPAVKATLQAEGISAYPTPA